METIGEMILIWSVDSTRTHLLKTRISWYRDFSWWSISSTCRDMACPAHKSFISVNKPFMSLSILQHKEINIVHITHAAPDLDVILLRCNYHILYGTFYTHPLLSAIKIMHSWLKI